MGIILSVYMLHAHKRIHIIYALSSYSEGLSDPAEQSFKRKEWAFKLQALP